MSSSEKPSVVHPHFPPLHHPSVFSLPLFLSCSMAGRVPLAIFNLWVCVRKARGWCIYNTIPRDTQLRWPFYKWVTAFQNLLSRHAWWYIFREFCEVLSQLETCLATLWLWLCDYMRGMSVLIVRAQPGSVFWVCWLTASLSSSCGCVFRFWSLRCDQISHLSCLEKNLHCIL